MQCVSETIFRGSPHFTLTSTHTPTHTSTLTSTHTSNRSDVVAMAVAKPQSNQEAYRVGSRSLFIIFIPILFDDDGLMTKAFI